MGGERFLLPLANELERLIGGGAFHAPRRGNASQPQDRGLHPAGPQLDPPAVADGRGNACQHRERHEHRIGGESLRRVRHERAYGIREQLDREGLPFQTLRRPTRGCCRYSCYCGLDLPVLRPGVGRHSGRNRCGFDGAPPPGGPHDLGGVPIHPLCVPITVTTRCLDQIGQEHHLGIHSIRCRVDGPRPGEPENVRVRGSLKGGGVLDCHEQLRPGLDRQRRRLHERNGLPASWRSVREQLQEPGEIGPLRLRPSRGIALHSAHPSVAAGRITGGFSVISSSHASIPAVG